METLLKTVNRYVFLVLRAVLVLFAINLSYVFGFMGSLPAVVVEAASPELQISVASVFMRDLIVAVVFARLGAALSIGFMGGVGILWGRLRLRSGKINDLKAIYKGAKIFDDLILPVQFVLFFVSLYAVHLGPEGFSWHAAAGLGMALCTIFITSPALLISPNTFHRRFKSKRRTAFKTKSALSLTYSLGIVLFVGAFFLGRTREAHMMDAKHSIYSMTIKHPKVSGDLVLLAHTDDFVFGATFEESPSFAPSFYIIRGSYVLFSGSVSAKKSLQVRE